MRIIETDLYIPKNGWVSTPYINFQFYRDKKNDKCVYIEFNVHVFKYLVAYYMVLEI